MDWKCRYFKGTFLGNRVVSCGKGSTRFSTVWALKLSALILIQLVMGMTITRLSWPLFSCYQGGKCSLLSSLRACPVITVATRSPSFPPTHFLDLTFSRRRQFWIHLSTYNTEPSQWFPEWGNFFTSDILESHPYMNIVHLVFVDWENVSWRKTRIQ